MFCVVHHVTSPHFPILTLIFPRVLLHSTAEPWSVPELDTFETFSLVALAKMFFFLIASVFDVRDFHSNAECQIHQLMYIDWFQIVYTFIVKDFWLMILWYCLFLYFGCIFFAFYFNVMDHTNWSNLILYFQPWRNLAQVVQEHFWKSNFTTFWWLGFRSGFFWHVSSVIIWMQTFCL